MDPFNIKASLKALAASKRQEPSSYQPPPQEEPRDPIQKLGGRIQKDIVKEAPPGLLERAGGTALSGLATVGNLLDVPGSMVRDVATWLPGGPKPANPLDQLVSPFTHHNRTTGRELLRGYGLAGKEDTMGNFTTGIGAEIAMDPLTYLTFGASALTRGGRAAKALNMMDDAPEIASRLLNRRVGKREARHVVTPRMLLENPRLSGEARARLQQRMSEMGVTAKDMDRQLGGLAKINLPFSNKPFKFGDKPFTFWGLTDEEGIIGAGKTRGRGPDVLQPVPHDIPGPDDLGPSGGSAVGGDGPDIPPTRGPAPDITDMPDSPVTPSAPDVPPVTVPAGGAPVVEPPSVAAKPLVDTNTILQPIDESNYGVFASVPGTKSQAKATLTYASEADETPMLFIDQLEKQPGSPKGSGRALINSIVDKVKDRNPMGVAGNFDSHEQLGAFASVFGKDNIRFLDRTTGQPVDIPFAEVNKTADNISKYTAVHYFIEPPKAAAKVEPEIPPQIIDPAVPSKVDVVDDAEFLNPKPATIEPQVPPQAVTPEVPSKVEMVDDAGFLKQPTGIPPSTLQPDLMTPEVVKEAKKRGRKPKVQAEPQVAAPAPTQPMSAMEAMQAEAGIKPTTPPNELAVKTQALLQEVANKRGASDAEVAEMLLRGDTASAIRRLETKPLDGLKIDGLMSVAKKNGILTDEQANAILAAIPPKFKGGMSVLDQAKQVSDNLASKNKLESRIDQTETPEFKNWFGDWKKDPANASKVVDADGKPLVVYHGTRHSDLGVAARKESNKRTLELASAQKEWLENSMPRLDELRKQRDAAKKELNEAAKKLAETLAPDKHSIDGIAYGLAHHSSRHDTLRDISDAWYPFARNQRSYTGPSGAVLKRADEAFAAIEPFRKKLNDIENEISKIPRRPEHTLGELVEEEPFFDTLRYGENDEGYLSAGSYFTADTRAASYYAGPYEGSGVLPVYLSLKNPYIHGVTVDNQVDKLANQIYEKKAQTLRNARADVDDYSRARATSRREALIERGYDGEIRDSKLAGKSSAFEDTEYVAFEDTQIKSAIGNRGTWSGRYILEAQGGKAGGAKMAPTKVDLNTLEGLPEQARPIVGDMINKIGQKLFDDVTMEVGGDAAKAVTTGDIDMDTGFIRIYNSAIESGIVDKTTVHELWHHLSKYITPEEVRIVQKEFDDAVKAHKGPIPYELSSIDEYFAHKLTDLSMKYLGREKPASVIGTAWAKALDVFEYIWDAIRQTLGYDQTKRILNSFLDGHRADAVKLTDATMQQRLVGDVEINGNILDSQVDPVIPNRDISGQLAQAKSAILGKSLDDIGESILDSAVGRQLTAMFDQGVLGQITRAGQEAARLAFKGYRDAVFKEREYMSHHLRTWYDLPNIREDIIMDEELGSLDEFIAAAGGDKALGAKNRMIEARKIQNGRVNDLRRLLEQPLWDEEGKWIPNAFRVEERELPAWVGQEKVNGQVINNPARRQQVAQMLTAWRLKAVQMLGDERKQGILLSLVNGYFPRLVSNMPGSNRSLWNPNYGKILDPTHPSAKRRKDWFVGYDDGTSVINDISLDAELSGAHSRRKVREQPSPAEIQQYANILWERYKDRLMGGRSQLTYGELAQADPKAFMKINKLTEEVMNLDPRHVEYQIPLFSNDLFSAMELRLEHHHRSIMHAKAIQHLIKKHAVARNLIGGDGQGVTLNQLLKESKYDSNVSRDLLESGARGDVALSADKNFWNQEIQPRINEVMRHYQAETAHYLRNPDAQPGTATGVTPYTDPGGRVFQVLPYEGDGVRRLVFPQFFDKKVPGVPNHVMKLEVNLDDPAETMVTWFDQVDDGANFVGESLSKILDNPTNVASRDSYVSGLPTYALFDQITVPQDIGDAITKFVQGPRTLEEVRPLVRGYDKGTNMWKMMQTGMLPFIGFHGRNFGSGQASNFYLGIQNDPRFQFKLSDPTTYLNPIRSFVQPIVDAHKIATGQAIEGAASMPQFAGMNLTDEAATEALRREMYAQGITGEKQGLSAEQLTDTVGTAASQFPGIDKAKSINPLAWQWSRPVPESTFAQRWLMPWMSKGVMSDADVFRPGQLGRDLGGYTEALNRLAPYIAMRRQGFDPKAAAREVNRAQVDYTSLSNFNREYTRRLFPFASYTLGMTPTVFGELASRPGGGMGRTVMATTSAGQSAEQGVTPDYIRETASIPLGMSEDGTRSYITGFGLPFEDPLQFAQLARGNVSGVLRELGSRMNPVPKSLIEIMTGRSLYQAGPFGGREIEDLDPTIGRILANINDLATGEKTEKAEPFLGNPWAEYLIANAGPGRMLNTARTITDPRKWDTVPWKLALNLGTGVRVADVSPSAQDAILRERLARVMKDFGGRMYSRPYFPDYAKEGWTPQEAEDAAKIDALLKLLGQRAKERRVQ